MYLRRLDIHGLRNLNGLQLELSPGANLFWGPNGSGKTSILEAVYLLSRGRSFRTRHLRSLINHQEESCTCFGLLRRDGRDIPIGVSRAKVGDFRFKLNGEIVRTASQLVGTLPTQLLNSHSFQLLEGSPGQRRAYLDWGVFHVEHSYRALWSRFQKCLKQRNSLLRHDRMDDGQLAVWDREFLALAEEISRYRREYLEALLPTITWTLDRLGGPASLDFQFYPGWDKNKTLPQVLDEARHRDRYLGHTQWGPHRADIRVKCDGLSANEVLSRGQAKIVIASLKVAQGFHFRQVTGTQCLYLVDDLPSELDADHRRKVGQLLQELGVQVLITGVNRTDLEESWPVADDNTAQAAMFHVEHGGLTKQR